MQTPAGKASLVLVGGLLGLAALTAVLTRGGQRRRDVGSSRQASAEAASRASGATAVGSNPVSLSHTRHTTISKLRQRIEFREELSYGATGKVLRARYRKSQCVFSRPMRTLCGGPPCVQLWIALVAISPAKIEPVQPH